MVIPWWPVVLVDIIGSALCLLIGVWSIVYSWSWTRKKSQDHFRHYLFLLTVAIGTFTISRSFGHLVKQFLFMAGQQGVWRNISPYSGAVNTATFITIFAFGIYFDRVRLIKLQADRDAVSLGAARARADAALEAEIRLRTVFDGLQDAICLSDNEHRVVFYNRKMQDMVPEIAIGGKCYEALYRRQEPCRQCGFAGLDGGQSFSGEREMSHLGITVSVTGIRMLWVDGRQVNLAVLRDVTGRKRLEAQLLQSQKMEAVGTLAGGIAHDFNNILTAITGYSDMLLIKLGDGNPLAGDVGEIRRAAVRAAALVRQLLAFSRKQKAVPHVVVDLNALLRNMRNMLVRLIGENIRLTVEPSGGQLPVQVDPGQIEQVVVNLVVNSRDALPRGGEIVIRTEVAVADAASGHPSGVDSRRFARLTVRDTGEGMAQEVLDKVFEPFFTTKDVGKGTGLGLSVVYGIVKQHGGWIDVESGPGAGTAFMVCLPLHEGTVESDDHVDGGVALPPGRGEKILLVEDQEEVRRVVISMLEGNGYQVLSAATLAEAGVVYEREQGQVDMLLSDIVLPDGSGLLLAERLLLTRPDLPVLMSSGYADERRQWSLLQERRLPFLQKPYSREKLLLTVRQVLDAGESRRADR